MGFGLTVLDAYAVVASIAGEPAAAEVDHLRSADGQGVRISTANVAEVIDRLVRVHGLTLAVVWERLRWMRSGGLEVVPVDEGIGRRAGELRASHYHRERSAVSLADCLALASAEAVGESLATPDPALAAMARAEGVDVVALPNSQGGRPTG